MPIYFTASNVERIAIIGTGIAGLGCAWNLRDAARLTLYEQDRRPGGHTNTVSVDEDGSEVPIDTGFIVFNKVTYPNLCRLFEELGVATQPGEMSFSVRHAPDDLEYNGMSLAKVFAQRRNFFRPRFHKFLGEVQRFFRIATAALDDPEIEAMTVRAFAARHGFGDDFLNHYLVPMSSAVWSAQPGAALDFPVEMLIRFFHNHGFLGVRTHHPWFTVSGGSRNYLRKILMQTGEPRLGSRVAAVEENGDHVTVRTAGGEPESFDRVVIAAHADQALAMLARPDACQRQLLAAFRYQRNHATLHTDATVMPRRRIAWASWNYRVEPGESGGHRATTHYWMNALQALSARRNYFVSINARGLVNPASVLYETEYDHPIFTVEAIRAQAKLGRLNARAPDQRIFFCGSYFRHGFHEDAYWSAIEAARAVRERLGAAACAGRAG